MDNVYQPPAASTSVATSVETTAFTIGRAIGLVGTALRQKFGLAFAMTILTGFLLSVPPLLLSLFIMFIVGATPAVAIFFLVMVGWSPAILAPYTVIGYRMITGELSIGDLFLGVRTYASTIPAAISLILGYILINAPFNIPYLVHQFETMSRIKAQGAAASEAVIQAGGTELLGLYLLALAGNLPAAYYWARMQLVLPLTLLRKQTVGQAFKASWRITRPDHWKLALYILMWQTAGFLVYLAGASGINVLLQGSGLPPLLLQLPLMILMLLFAIYFTVCVGSSIYQLLEDSSEGMAEEPTPGS